MATDPGFNETNTAHTQVHAKQPTDWILCYLVCPRDSAGGFLGAILLTDNRARPLHFAFVQPIKPTNLQSILYGSTLEEYIKVDVITQKLWQGLPRTPDVVFVNDRRLLAARRVARVPTAFLAKDSESQANPPSLSTLQYDTGSHEDDQAVVGEIIVCLENSCNLIEPFERMHRALIEALKSGV